MQVMLALTLLDPRPSAIHMDRLMKLLDGRGEREHRVPEDHSRHGETPDPSLARARHVSIAMGDDCATDPLNISCGQQPNRFSKHVAAPHWWNPTVRL